MDNQTVNHIGDYKKRWDKKSLVACVLFGIAAMVAVLSAVVKGATVFWLFVPLAGLVVFLLCRLFFFPALTIDDVIRYVNRSVPAVEESTGLLLKPNSELNMLEQLQQRKIAAAIRSVPEPPILIKRVKVALLCLVVAVVFSSAVFLVPMRATPISASVVTAPGNPVTERVLPQIEQVSIRIIPPAYTGRPARVQARFNLVAESGSVVTWLINTNTKVNKVALVLNGRSTLPMKASQTGTKWMLQMAVTTPGFYQVKVGVTLSELYSIEVIRDQPPGVSVVAPGASTLIEYGQAPRSRVAVTITDDYAISSVFMAATIASGSGESVKFKEQRLSFPSFKPGANRYQLNSQIDARSLGMQPGDELYCYVSATDNLNQVRRSDIFIIRLEDTAQLMSLDGLVSGVGLKPEFFRSQRQIIIETEQLLRDRDTLAADKFAEKSNELGTDQKMLRLRYGKFLGEETDNQIDHDHDEHGGAEELTFGNAEHLLDEYSHKHDVAEDASFFDPQTKSQLKATLNEMWKAELQLRTIKPKDALPFEYKALRLLKDLQQKSRAYVAKTGVNTTPLKPEKRLTGELAGIGEPRLKQTIEQPDQTLVLRKAIGILEQVRSGEEIDSKGLLVLQNATAAIMRFAAQKPANYLPGLKSLKNISNRAFSAHDITIASRALQLAIVAAPIVPQQQHSPPATGLSTRYFKNLNSRHD